MLCLVNIGRNQGKAMKSPITRVNGVCITFAMLGKRQQFVIRAQKKIGENLTVVTCANIGHHLELFNQNRA